MADKIEFPKIYEAISNVMGEIGAIGKNKKNTQGTGYMYRGIDDVMNALNPAMVKHKVFVVPEIIEQTREERTSKAGAVLMYSICKIKYTFYTIDGSSVCATVIGEAMDSGDKGTNKSMAIAFKYACFQVFCIPTEEMKDPDAETHELQVKTSNHQTQTVPVATISSDKIKLLTEMCEKRGFKAEKTFPNGIEKLTEEQYTKAIKQLETLPEKKENKENE
jgi:hypothetical protein